MTASTITSPKRPISLAVRRLRFRHAVSCAILAFTSVAVLFGATASAAPAIEEQSALDVGQGSATLEATVNAGGAAASYHFEYDVIPYTSEATHGTLLPSPDASLGDGVGPVSVTAHLQQLLPGTTYHYRIVVAASGERILGQERTLTTRPASSDPALADGRSWELVSPPDKHGAGLEAMTKEGGVIQASLSGDAITYIAAGPVVDNPEGNAALEYSQVLSSRTSGGWRSEDLATPHNALSELLAGEQAEYKAFSPDLSLGVVNPKGATPLPPLPPDAEKTVYRRRNEACAENPGDCYLPLVTAANVLPGAHFGEVEQNNVIGFAGAAPGLEDVILESPEALTADAVRNEERPNLYEWAGGQLRLVSVLPDGHPTTAESQTATLGSRGRLVRQAVSTDGSHVIWEAGETPRQHLYIRDVTRDETAQLDVIKPGGEEGTQQFGVTYQGASMDDGRIFFTDEQRLTPDSHAGLDHADLYVFEQSTSTSPGLGTLTDLTPATSEESAAVQDVVLGTSDDGSYVYFVANGALAAGATPGSCGTVAPSEAVCNLYEQHLGGHGWEPRTFVATLSGDDAADWAAEPEGDLSRVTSRVSPNGRYLAFMSRMSLTGFDNHDAVSGVADEEVYEYDAMAHRLACVSCNPTSSRPEGVFDPRFTEEQTSALLVDQVGFWTGHWIAALIPGWTPVDVVHSLYQSRYLSNDGRLFFDTPEPLAPGDINGLNDVYEYEPFGVGRCGPDTAGTRIAISPAASGCLALISSGTSTQESAFLDASETGDDVFFLTTAPLGSNDIDHAYDVYDAHVCSAERPCAVENLTGPSPCTGSESCQGVTAGVPAEAVVGTEAAIGNGNVLGQPRTTARRQSSSESKRARALRLCKRLRSAKKRRACKKAVLRRYGRARPRSRKR
jgi:hypothetical protein